MKKRHRLFACASFVLLCVPQSAEQGREIGLHNQQAGKQQQTAEIGLGGQHLVGHKEGQDGVEHRFQTEDDTHMGGGGILKGNGLDEKGGSGAEEGEDQYAAPDLGAMWERGSFKIRDKISMPRPAKSCW